MGLLADVYRQEALSSSTALHTGWNFRFRMWAGDYEIRLVPSASISAHS